MKKVVAMIMCILMVLSSAGCAGKQDVPKNTNTITDFAGRKVTLPEGKIIAAANNSWISSQIAMLAGAETVGVAPASFSSGHTERFAELISGTNDIPLADGDKISAETMFANGVNLFFTLTQEEAESYTKAGITSIVMNYDTTENVADSFVLIGNIFGGEALEKANKIYDFFLSCAESAKERSKDVTDCPSVYCIAANTQSTPYVTQGEETFATKLFTMCGIKYVTSGIGTYVTVSAEFIMEQDPDYIMIDGYHSEEAYKELINDPVLKNLRAVKEEKIIVAPIGILRPILRPGAEIGIGIMWLSNTFYPEKSNDVSIVDESVRFYKECFGWNVSKEEVLNMLQWTNE